MSRSLARYSTLIIIVALTGLALVLWLAGLFLLWLLLQALGVEASFWTMTEALSTAVAAAAVLGAGFVAYRELNEVSSSRHMEVADKLFEELNAPECIEARRWVFRHLPDDPAEGIAALDDEGRAAIKTVLNSLDRIAFLTQGEWIPIETVMPWMNPMVVKAWQKLGPYVEHERRRRSEPDYYAHAGRLAERCLAWRRAHVPDARTVWLEDAL
jgi:hypothetical protein